MIWELSHRADPRARVIADRHYSRQKIGTPQFVPPGRCLVLVTDGAFWVSSFPFKQFVKHAWGGAWICSAFRKEFGDMKPSDMIRQAVAATRYYWGDAPELGMITFVDPEKVRHKRDPGRCFLKAGFQLIGHTKRLLPTLQLLPDAMPDPEPALNQQMRLLA